MNSLSNTVEEEVEVIDPVFSADEFHELSRELEVYHSVFYKMWEIGKPQFVDDTKTAYVGFDEHGNTLIFGINREFWESISKETKIFVLCHEMMHILLDHFNRSKKDKANQDIENRAMDIAINELLVDGFGLIKEDIDNYDKYCWVETLFPNSNTPINESFEYYYNKLLEQKNESSGKGDGKEGGEKGGEGGGNGKGETVDDHSKSFMGGDKANPEGKETQEAIDKLFDKLNNDLSNEDKQTLLNKLKRNGYQAGTGAGTSIRIMDDPRLIKKKSKWETVIKKWAMPFIKNDDKDVDQWVKSNRKYTFMNNSKIFLPTEMEVEENREMTRIKVHFFLDTSGSCSGLANRFWKAANSLPEDRFDVELYCFDTRVYEVNLKEKKLRGFGGTRFDIIEAYIQNKIANGKKEYPHAVFVMTDGEGNTVRPKFPNKWYVFLTKNKRSCFTNTCNFYNLTDFE